MGCVASVFVTPNATFDPGQTSSTISRATSSFTNAGSSIACTPCPIRTTLRPSIACQTDAAPPHSPAWLVKCSPASCAISKLKAKSSCRPCISSPPIPKPTIQSSAVSAAHRAVSLARSGPRWRIQVGIPRMRMPCCASACAAASRMACKYSRQAERSPPPQNSGDKKLST